MELKVGDLVRVYDPTAEGSKPVKFRKQWVGPYFIRGKKGMLFELEEMEGGEIKSLFHPMKLKQVNEKKPQQNPISVDRRCLIGKVYEGRSVE